MRVISFMNYKGGVGKTTITANIGAGLANRGHRVLMIDLDPQTNLTFSFYPPSIWEEDLKSDRTIKRWFEAHLTDSGTVPRLSELVSTPPVNEKLASSTGQLDLIASQLALLDIDMKLAGQLFSADPHQARLRQLRLQRLLADALEDEELAAYDYVLVDCAPDFGIVTRIAMVASDYILVPARADRLSTLGITHFTRSLRTFVQEHNALGSNIMRINPKLLGIVFTMVQIYGGQPIAPQLDVITLTKKDLKLPVFNAMIRNANRAAISSADSGIPVILGTVGNGEIVIEFNELVEEFVQRIEGML